MKKFRTIAAVVIMLIICVIGFFIGSFLNNPIGGAILGVLISGIACIIYTIDNSNNQ